MTDLNEATEDLNEAYEAVRQDLGRVFVAFDDLRAADATADIHSLLENLGDVIKDVRTGGLVGSGANRHRRARDKWLEAGGKPN